MTFNFKAVIEDYCGTGTLSEEEVDFLERENIRKMNTISEILSPSIAHWNICELAILNSEVSGFLVIPQSLIGFGLLRLGSPMNYRRSAR